MTEIKWLKDCEICNAGLCSQMKDYISKGMSEREASRKMEEDCEGEWSADKIYGRYRYYVKGHAGGSVGKPHTKKSESVNCASLLNQPKDLSAIVETFITIRKQAVDEIDHLRIAIKLKRLANDSPMKEIENQLRLIFTEAKDVGLNVTGEGTAVSDDQKSSEIVVHEPSGQDEEAVNA